VTYKILTFPSPGQLARAASNKHVDDFSFTIHDGLGRELAGGSGYLVEKDAKDAAAAALRSL
jgi:hypothetical protein